MVFVILWTISYLIGLLVTQLLLLLLVKLVFGEGYKSDTYWLFTVVQSIPAFLSIGQGHGGVAFIVPISMAIWFEDYEVFHEWYVLYLLWIFLLWILYVIRKKLIKRETKDIEQKNA